MKRFILPLVAILFISGCNAVPLMVVDTKDGPDYHFTTDGLRTVENTAPLLTMVIDGDEYGEYYYFLDEYGRAITPSFEEKAVALDHLIKRGYTPYYKIDRRTKNWFDRLIEERRKDNRCFLHYQYVICR